MTQSNLCRLCVNICNDSKSLFDGNGRGNELYEFTYRYLHPKIVNLEEAKHLTVICLQCWRHVCDIQSFQTTILMAQCKLYEEKGGRSIVKVEDAEWIEPTERAMASISVGVAIKAEPEFIVPEMELIDSDDDAYAAPQMSASPATWNDEEVEDIKPLISLPELEIMDVVSSDSDADNSEDEMPLAKRLARSLSHRKVDPLAEHLECTYVRLDDLMAKWMPNIKCVACPASYTRLTTLQRHFQQEHSNKDFYISCCSLRLSKRNQIKDHLLLHNNPAAFKCEMCDKTFRVRKSFRGHINRIHPETQRIVCQLCDKGFNSKRGLRCHYQSVHKTNDILRQPKTEPSLDEIPNRIKLETETTEESPSAENSVMESGQVILPDDNPAYTCNECGKITYSKSSHYQHVWYNHRYKPKNDCTYCGRSCKTAREMREHIAHVHLHRDLYACAFCPKTFKKLAHVSHHRKTKHPQESRKHFYTTIEAIDKLQDQPITGDMDDMESATDSYSTKRYERLDDLLAKWIPNIKCELCSESYTNLSLLEDHFRLQHPQETFHIVCCSRTFNTRPKIKDHLLLHNNPQAFKCEACGKICTTRKNLRYHKSRVHFE